MAVADCPATSWCPEAGHCRVQVETCARVAPPANPGSGAVGLWATLIGSAVALAAVGAYAHGPPAIALIVLLMAANAALMVIKFMHLDSEPAFLKWLMAGTAVLLVILLVALVPDIVVVFGRVGA